MSAPSQEAMAIAKRHARHGAACMAVGKECFCPNGRDLALAVDGVVAERTAEVLAVLRDVNSDRLALLAWLSKMPDVPESWATTTQIDKFHRFMRAWMTGDVQTQVAHLAIARQDERAASIAALGEVRP